MPLRKGYLTSPAWDVLIFRKECCGISLHVGETWLLPYHSELEGYTHAVIIIGYFLTVPHTKYGGCDAELCVCAYAGKGEPCASVSENPSAFCAGGVQCRAGAAGFGFRGEQRSVMGDKLHVPGMGDLQWLFGDRDVAHLADPQILKLPNAEARGPWEIPSGSAAVLVAGSSERGQRWEQAKAVLGAHTTWTSLGHKPRLLAASSQQLTEGHRS